MGGRLHMATAAQGIRISSGWQDGTETLYAVVTCDEKDMYAIVYDNGSTRVKFPSGRICDVTATTAGNTTPEKTVQKAVCVLSVDGMVAVVHRPPTFTSVDAFFAWLRSIGLDHTS
jgi:hypothetical protein